MRQPVAYRRFPSAAAAIRFAVEELSQAGLAAAVLEVKEERFDHIGIRQLYEDKAYPLRRRAARLARMRDRFSPSLSLGEPIVACQANAFCS